MQPKPFTVHQLINFNSNIGAVLSSMSPDDLRDVPEFDSPTPWAYEAPNYKGKDGKQHSRYPSTDGGVKAKASHFADMMKLSKALE